MREFKVCCLLVFLFVIVLREEKVGGQVLILFACKIGLNTHGFWKSERFELQKHNYNKKAKTTQITQNNNRQYTTQFKNKKN